MLCHEVCTKQELDASVVKISGGPRSRYFSVSESEFQNDTPAVLLTCYINPESSEVIFATVKKGRLEHGYP